jgi:hypothetical protein
MHGNKGEKLMRNLSFIVFFVSVITRIIPCASLLEENQQAREKSFASFPLIKDCLNLYKIDNDFAMHVIYEDQEISQVRVAPKYYLEKAFSIDDHHKYLSEDKYHELLGEIQKEKSLGKLVQKGTAGVSSNDISDFIDQYECGLVRHYDSQLPNDNPKKGLKKVYFGFRIIYYRMVSGTLEEKRKNVFANEVKYEVKIDDHWYWITADEYRNIAIDNNITIKKAAPVEISL